MTRFLAGRWPPWIPAGEAGPGRLCFRVTSAQVATARQGRARGRDVMGSIRGFRCGLCRAEVLATAEPAGLIGRTEWTPPVLCCGQPLRALEPDQVLSTLLTHRRVARCPRCGYKVRLIVHPAGSLVCMLCQTDFVIIGGNPDRDDEAVAAIAPVPDVRR